ncbi:TonB-dependent receptor plug domain-containing protein [Halobacteriovorax sp. CON-3]|uniref:TonB-dependent receptor plug domain-containing protein n=1 Tax=Halobacteriovorax sp. CON-3 TaxID=3157710 RepID=UPI003711123C
MSRRKIIKTLFYYATAFLPLTSIAQITIKATKLETSSERVTSAVTVITREEIENTDATTLQQLLQSKASIFIGQSGQIGAASSLRLRGLPTGFSKVLIDNIELTDPTDINNSYQINHINLDNIESIEILKGSQSILYGSNAIGGVLKINTKKGIKSSRVSAEYGSYNTAKVAAQTSGHMERLSYGFNFSYLHSDGYSSVNEDRLTNAEADSYKNLSFSLNTSYLINNQLELNYQAQFIDSEIEIDGFNFAPPFNPIDVADNDLNKYNQYNNFLSLNYNSADERFTLTPSIRYSTIRREDPQGFTPLFRGEETDLKLDATYEFSKNLNSFYGVQYLKQDDLTLGNYSELFSLYTTFNYAYKDWFSDIGLRFDKFSTFNLNTIASFGLGYNFTRELSLKGHLSSGYKLPTLYQIANQLEMLDPTDSINSELTLSYKKITYQAELTIFNYDLKNQIDYDTINMGYLNITKSQIQGIEFNFNKEFQNSFSIATSVTIQKATNKITDSDLARTPEALASLELGYQINDNQSISNWWQYVGKREDFGSMPSYVIGNINYEYQNLNFKIINILDKDYENIRYYGTMARSYFLGYKLDF